jgi:hypothetical protein
MKGQSRDPLLEALTLIRKPAVAGPQSAPEPMSAVPADICDLFLAELESRRERLQNWLRLLDEQIRLENGRPPLRRAPRASACRLRGSGHSVCTTKSQFFPVP